MSDNKKYVYVMQCKEHVKFGVSANPEIRIKELQTGNPHKIHLLLKLLYRDSFRIESKMHEDFKDKRAQGEWFKIDEEIKDFVKYLKNIEYTKGK